MSHNVLIISQAYSNFLQSFMHQLASSWAAEFIFYSWVFLGWMKQLSEVYEWYAAYWPLLLLSMTYMT